MNHCQLSLIVIHTIRYVITCPTLNVHLISIKQSILALNTGTPFPGISEMHQHSIVLMKGTKSIYYPSQLLINCYHILLSSLLYFYFYFLFLFVIDCYRKVRFSVIFCPHIPPFYVLQAAPVYIPLTRSLITRIHLISNRCHYSLLTHKHLQ